MLHTYDDLLEIKEKTINSSPRFNNTLKSDTDILICSGTGCLATKSSELIEEFTKLIEEKNINNVRVFKTGCFGFCKLGPIIMLYPQNTFYCEVEKKDVDEILQNLLTSDKPVERLLYKGDKNTISEKMSEINFFHSQKRIALRNCGLIDPESIDEYIAMDGYFALLKCLKHLKRRDIIKEISDSGLRGRGGGGFLTGRKWQFSYDEKSKNKYIVCNADEGDPGAFMDRSILEGDPHSVIEAITIAGYAIGAKKGFIYVRAEYPVAIRRLEIALAQARKYGLLGKKIFDSDFEFTIEIRLGAGAFVCGEETALLNSVVGNRGEPRPRPPFPASQGLYNKPTLVNNVETFANIPKILLYGSNWFTSYGVEKSTGTKVFALAGQINNTGLIEVPMGTTLRTVIYDIGGGIPNNKKFKAIQTGGPSGGCIPEQFIDTPIDFESLNEVGSMMGSGGMIVLDENNCMVDIAKFYLEFSQDESCGKCTPCRIGTKRMLEILNSIVEGHGKEEDLDEIKHLCYDIKEGSLCGLGQTAPNPVLSTLKYFRDEYIAHVKHKYCPAGVCEKLKKYYIIDEKCVSCGLCAKLCPVDAISGEAKKEPFVIDKEKCIKCGACYDKCPVSAIDRG